MWMTEVPSSWHHGGLYLGAHWMWWLFWIFVTVVVAWAFLRLVRDERSRDRWEVRREGAEEILRRRFGEGEIDEDEFLHRMHLLRESRTGTAGE